MDCHTISILTLNICGIYSETKLTILRQFLKNAEADVVLLQEVAVSAIHCPGYEETTNVGPARRGTAILWKTGLPLKVTAVLPCGRGMAARLGETSVINLYAPSGTQGRAARNEFFSSGITPLLAKTNGKIIIGGDLNCIVRKEECTGKQPPCTTLISLMASLHLKDVWREKHTHLDGFTFRSAASAARLDRFLVDSDTAPSVTGISLLEAACSDHLAVLLSVPLSVQRQKPSPTRWKLDNRILEDQNFLPGLEKHMKLLRDSPLHSSDVVAWWETVAKRGVRNFCKKFAREMHEDENSLLKFFQNALNELCQADAPLSQDLERKKQLKEAIQNIQRQKMKNMQIRAKLERPSPGENSTVYHIVAGLKQRKKSKIEKLRDKNGQELTAQQELMALIKQHFEEKFQNVNNISGNNNTILDEIENTVTEEENEQLMSTVTAQELEAAVKRCKPGKSPGEDGLPSDLYKAAWPVLGGDLLAMVNSIFTRRRVGDSHKVGTMVLVPKVAEVTEVKHLRPITLLNADGKLVSRVLEARLKKLENKLLHESQVRGGGARNIGAALGDIRDAIAMVGLDSKRRAKTKACLVSMDLQGAFDNLQHDFMWNVLTKAGIQGPALQLIKSMYDGATTAIQVNGQMTPPIRLLVGVRQGCPLSMALFNAAMSPLIMALSRRLEGLRLQDPQNPNRSVRMAASSYVDDAVAILRSPAEIPDFLEVLEKFSTASGLRVNLEKTKALRLGSWPKQDALPFSHADSMKILGVTYASTISKMAALNWPDRTGAVRAVLADTRLRRLDLKQRTTYINTYVIPLLLHLGQVLPIPAGVERKIRSCVIAFLKAGSLFTVPLERLTRSPLEGGLSLQHHQWKSMAMFAARWQSSARSQTPIFSGMWLKTLISQYKDPKTVPGKAAYFRTFLQLQNAIPADAVGTALGRAVYSSLLDQHPAPPVRVELQHPTCDWPTIWANISSKAVPAATRTAWFKLVHDLVPTAERLHRHGLASSPLCQRCKQTDTLIHRLVQCAGRQQWDLCAKQVAYLAKVGEARVTPDLLLRPDIQGTSVEHHEKILRLLSTTATNLETEWRNL